MVAARSGDDLRANVPTQAELSKPAIRMVWAPRSGRSKAFKRWRYDMLDLLGDLGFESFEDVMNLEPPSKAALAQIATDSVQTIGTEHRT